MKKLFIIISIIIGLCVAQIATAAPTSTIVQNLQITQVTNAPCLETNSIGLVASTTCGSGGGGGTVGPSTSTYVAIFNTSGTLTGFTNLIYSSSTNTLQFGGSIFDLSNSGGTNINSSGTISIISGYGGASAPSLNLFANGLIDVVSPNTTPIRLDNGSQYASLDTSLLSSNHNYQFPNNSGVFCLTNTCLTTSTFNATGTPFYITGWNSLGNALLATTSIFMSSSTGDISIEGNQDPFLTITSSSAPLFVNGNLSTDQGIAVANGPITDYGGNAFFVFAQNQTSSYGSISNVLNNFNNNDGLLIRKTSTGIGNYLDIEDSSSNIILQVLNNKNVLLSNNLNASGTITQAGIPVCTTSTCLTSGVATTTINGTQATIFRLIGDSTTISSTVSGATTTFFLINTGNWAGTWQGVNSTTFYLASNPSGYISTSTGLTTANFASPNISQWTNNSGYITAAITSINGNTSAAQTFTAGAGISVASSGGNTTTTNTGVTSFNGATGTVTYAPSTTIPTVFVSSVNGLSGTVTGIATSSGVVAGTCTNCTATVNANGIVTAFSNGSAGGSGSGNLFVTPTSSVQAFNEVVYAANGSSTVLATSSVYSYNDGDVSINTSTENGVLNVVNNSGIPVFRASTSTLATSSPALSILGASTTATLNVPVLQILGDGHINATGSIPVVTSCGTSPIISGNDAMGQVTVGSITATGCTITFATPYEATPHCQLTNESMSITSALGYSETTAAITVTQATGLVGDKLDYDCSETL